jgi:putative PIN family toxin of toxin-antitoxin system
VLRAVLDANVYVSAAIRPEGSPGQILTRFLRQSAFDNILAPAIIDETLRALAYPKVRKHVRSGLDVAAWFESIVLLSDLVTGEFAVERVSEDPDDDKYIAAALEGRAAFIVTGDPDLLEIEHHVGVRIVSPREFVQALG